MYGLRDRRTPVLEILNDLGGFQAHGPVHHNSILIKIQLDATVGSLVYFTAKSLYMFRVSQHPSPGVLKSVTAASGTDHNFGTATSLPTWPR